MDEKVNTNTLMRRIFKANNLEAFFENNKDHLLAPDFCRLLKEFCCERGMTPARVIERSEIDRTYGHQLFNGTRKPSRDKIIQLSVALELSVDETQKLLRLSGKSPLYPRLKRDAVILFGLINKMPVLEIQETLAAYGMTMLGGVSSETE